MIAWVVRVGCGIAVFTAFAYLALFCFLAVASFIRLDLEAFRYVAGELTWLGFRWVLILATLASVLIFSEEY